MFQNTPIALGPHITALAVAAASVTHQWPTFGVPSIANATQSAPFDFVPEVTF